MKIAAARPDDLPLVERFVAEIQTHERARVPEVRPATEIAADYARWLVTEVAARDGVLLLAWDGDTAIGMVAAWPARDDDPLLASEHRTYAYVSDIAVAEGHRRQGVGRQLLAAAETAMRERGCRQMRICSKAGNVEALATYADAGYAPYEVILWKRLD
jgi:ribosomal protein S18 acetylase RimI-like enzyme